MESSAHAQFNTAGVAVIKSGLSRYQSVRWLVVMVLHACSPAPENPPVQTPQIAELILDAAQRAMGVWPDSGSFQLLAAAAVQGPDGDFRTMIHSSTDGRMRMEQTPSGFLAGVGAAEGWLVDPESGQTEDLGSRVLRKAVFRQAEEVFTYTFDRLELGPLPDSLFEAPAG